jgi:hypothetical protein
MNGERGFPGIGLVDAPGAAVGLDQQVGGLHGKAERRARQGGVGRDLAGAPGRARHCTQGPWVWRLVAKAAGHIDAAEQDLQHVDGAAGVEAVGMGRDAAHGMHRHRPADHALMAPALPVGPRLVDDDFLLEGGMGKLRGDAPDAAASMPVRAATASGA